MVLRIANINGKYSYLRSVFKQRNYDLSQKSTKDNSYE